MLHDLASIRRVLVSCHDQIRGQAGTQEVLVCVFANRRWTTDWGTSEINDDWMTEVDHAIQQLADHAGFDYMDSSEICRDLVKTKLGSEIDLPVGTHRLQFSNDEVAASLAKIIALTPADVSNDPRVLHAMLLLSPLEQKFLSLLATHGEGQRVPNGKIAAHCWCEAVDDEVIRNVYRGVQNKLISNRSVQVHNARKGYKLILKN